MEKKFWVVNQVNAFTAEILMYGFIGEYEAIDDAAFITDLRTLENSYTDVNIRVNCGGGDVYKGLTIFNAICNSRLRTHGFVDGIAASMGAVIIAACTDVQMSKYARYMTHRVRGGNFGNADDMRNFANQLDELENSIASILAKRTGLSVEDAKKKYIVNTDRWISAEQALEEKVIDGIYDADPVNVPANATSPQQLFNAYHKVFNISTQKNYNMKLIAQALGLAETATEQEVLNAINALKAERDTANAAVVAQNKARAKALFDNAVANRQLVEADRPTIEALAEANYEAAVALVNKIPVVKKPTQIISQATGKVEGGADNTIDTWEKLCEQSDAFIAEFKKNNLSDYEALHTAYLKKPVTDKA
ncbi:MAG TPA: ATP-dependent Clp protease proteolytic subunit [Ferruginibacter sp.]|nr:ATP-dependent Clp protease proteolytic subunit [Ferruginibacter sp.]HMP22182.1 ATP-dependent Clp protease proteolytic subunit [Ferruginibacter sp.]